MDFNFDNRTIAIEALTGSHNYNLNTPRSDEDFKFFVLPSFDDLYAGERFSGGNHSDELDYTVHDVRALAELLAKSHINFVEILFSKKLKFKSEFSFLFTNREKYASMDLWKFFKSTMGMGDSKVSERHTGTGTTKALVEKYGYDTKQACHALRCYMTVVRYSVYGNMAQTLWFDDNSEERKILLAVKNGEFPEHRFMAMVNCWRSAAENCKSLYDGVAPNETLYHDLQDRIKLIVKNNLGISS